MKTKKRYRALAYLTVGGLGPFQKGEVIDSDQVPLPTLQEAEKNGELEAVDTLVWHPEALDGQGEWRPAPVAEKKPAPAPVEETVFEAEEEAKPVEEPKPEPRPNRRG